MTNHIAGELIAASAEDRTLKYLLLPYGDDKPGFTNLGKVTASKGVVDFSEAIGKSVNLEHRFQDPIGKFSHIEETEEGLIATVDVANTTKGNDALEEARSGLRRGISVELKQAVIKAGKLVSGVLDAAGLVVRPAFSDAVLMASDYGTEEEEEEQLPQTDLEKNSSTADRSDEVDEETNADSTEEAETEITNKESEMTENAAVPSELAASKNGGAPASALEVIATAYKNRDNRLAAALEETGTVGETNLFAALAGTTGSSNTANIEQSQWLGHMWEGKTYERKYASLLTPGTLTNWKVEGWHFVNRPTVADYAGDLAEIHSSTVTTEPYSEEAERVAGGWKVDRKYSDFGNTEFLNSFYAAAVEDYAIKSDAKALNFITSNSTPVTATAAPTGVNPLAAKIVDGALSMLDFATPDFAIVPVAEYRNLLLARKDDSLEYLSSSLGLENGSLAGFKIIPSTDVTSVFVGARQAASLYELGGSPIRVSALDLAHGAQDEALFGYLALVLNNARGLVVVS